MLAQNPASSHSGTADLPATRLRSLLVTELFIAFILRFFRN
jgi:hypothetical protein